jgi:hypothetical protein
LDLQNGVFHWSKNGKEFGEAYRIPGDLLKDGAFFPTASLKDMTLDVNFGEKQFKYPPKDKTYLPVAYTPPMYTKYNSKRGPDIDGRPNVLLPIATTDRKEDAFLSPKKQVVVLPGGGAGDASKLSSNQSRTSTVGDKRTVVETSDPDIQIEIYTDEFGNIVRRTIKKTTIRTTTTTRTTERTESQMNAEGTRMIIKTFGFDEDDDDRSLTDAILAVTGLDMGMTVQADSLGTQLTALANQAAAESDI